MGSDSSKLKERVEVPEQTVRIITIRRDIHFWIIVLISIVAVVGNICAIKTVIFRKYKYLQKTCIISLAVSDLLTVVFYAVNHLDSLSKPLMTWHLGEPMCYFVPTGMVLGSLASSVALLAIALDRYHNVIYALSKKWNPPLWKCLVGAAALWTVCAALSYPVLSFYIFIPIRVNGENGALCLGSESNRNSIMLYYVIMIILFFLPIISLFFWFYFKIALLIWQHRKPPGDSCQRHEYTETSTTAKSSHQHESVVPQIRSAVRKRNVQMERKIRTFIIVLVLIFAYIGCRMPYWTWMVYKLVNANARGDTVWMITFVFVHLNLLNCAMNPFLYTYLNFTMIVCRKVNDFVRRMCCYCCSNTEFEEFETGKPERIMGYDAQQDERRPKVKFIDVPIVPKYTQKEGA